MAWPYNISTYRSLFNQVHYTRVAYGQSIDWDYGRLSLDKAVKKIYRKPRNPLFLAISGILLILLGALLWDAVISYIIIFMGIRQIWILKYRSNLYKIFIKFHKTKAQGAFHILNPVDIFLLHDVPPELAFEIPVLTK